MYYLKVSKKKNPLIMRIWIEKFIPRNHHLVSLGIVGEPEIQKLEKKVAGKTQNFRLYSQLVWCFRRVKRDIEQILSLTKDVYLWGNHSHPNAGFM